MSNPTGNALASERQLRKNKVEWLRLFVLRAYFFFALVNFVGWAVKCHGIVHTIGFFGMLVMFLPYFIFTFIPEPAE